MALALFRSKKIKQLEKQVKAIQQANNQRVVADMNNYLKARFNSVNYYPDYSINEATNKYVTSDQVYSVINKIAQTTALIPIYTYLKTQDKAFRQLKALTNRQFYSTKGLFDIRVMQLKALEDAPENDELNQLLENPNAYQSKTEFLIALYSYYLLNGEVFIWKERVVEGANEGKIIALHIIPPSSVAMRLTQVFPQEVVGYDVTINGRQVLVDEPPENIIHWKTFNPNYDISGSHLRGLSPLKAGGMPVERLNESDNRSLNQLKNGAVPGIVYDKSFAGDESEQTIFDNQKKAFYDFASNPSNHGAPFFVGSEKGYLPIGLSAADLKIIELQSIDFKRLCNIYKVSTILFNSDVAATESNVIEQIKQMYTQACLPLVYGLTQKLNAALLDDFKDKPRYINADISAITELQDDVKSMIEAIAAMPISLTGDEQRALLNYEATELDWMKQPMIKQGYSFYEEISIPPINPDLLNE